MGVQHCVIIININVIIVIIMIVYNVITITVRKRRTCGFPPSFFSVTIFVGRFSTRESGVSDTSRSAVPPNNAILL